ncbi:MAG: hypothetical protein OH354_01600 [Candidatus Parvarchaeota archaeon]|nr:hypothetical protein [Candidatus Jingweiarchaeum tengchongense]MCW1300095.1 hypothetical protein [Candidatus Jingweiarchaeum tengchongense]MCW1304449.1 hypothetical protein [Candidatus Jingweiarchaeum tengchongense]MCW1305616.1 hypothetical protein [Candidatus Jingweiarchaeum tengchongense]MCW1309263.1 hypothetical protein [Candidatus Jingweiarchaeum tengchongense]
MRDWKEPVKRVEDYIEFLEKEKNKKRSKWELMKIKIARKFDSPWAYVKNVVLIPVGICTIILGEWQMFALAYNTHTYITYPYSILASVGMVSAIPATLVAYRYKLEKEAERHLIEDYGLEELVKK